MNMALKSWISTGKIHTYVCTHSDDKTLLILSLSFMGKLLYSRMTLPHLVAAPLINHPHSHSPPFPPKEAINELQSRKHLCGFASVRSQVVESKSQSYELFRAVAE
jgi:hypothetical protein